MSYRMNREQMLEFVKLYKRSESLWNTDSPHYKNREARCQALKKISEEMRIEGFGPREVAQKIKNLRSTYNQELKKINSSEMLGLPPENVYKPRLSWFEEARDIFTKCNYSATSNNYSGDESNAASDYNVVENPFCHLQLDAVKEEVLENLPSQIEDDLNSFCESSSKNQFESFNRINEVLEKLEKTVNTVQPPEPKELHEYDAFGQYVSSVLKGMSPECALTVQTEIFEIIAREKRKSISVNL